MKIIKKDKSSDEIYWTKAYCALFAGWNCTAYKTNQNKTLYLSDFTEPIPGAKDWERPEDQFVAEESSRLIVGEKIKK